MLKKYVIAIVLFLVQNVVFAQSKGIILGNLKDKNTQEIIFPGTVILEGTEYKTTTDFDGNYKLEVPVGTYNVKAIYSGYVSLIKYNIIVSSGNAQVVNFEMEVVSSQLSEVTVSNDKSKSAVATDMITPLSVQQLTTEEIKSNPGGNFDVSRVIQTLPGVGSSAGGAARNDIIIRGGAPNENVYYLDGIEIPVLNHFQTQGSSGGAQGILNVSFIEDVRLTSSAFDARYDNALASTFVIKQRDGNPERISGNVRAGFTEAVLTLEGPISKKTTFLASARKSYLDFLFGLIDLPIRPNFYDFQYKVTHKIDEKTTLTAIGLGAIDRFTFATTKSSTPENVFITRSQPYINQWNYTTGFNLKRKVKKGYMNFAISRNMFNNQLDKFVSGEKIESDRTFKLVSQEIENKFRFDINKFIDGWKITAGVSAQYVKYNTDLYNKINIVSIDTAGIPVSTPQEFEIKSAIEFFKYGVFGQVAKNFLKEKLLLSFGVRTDMNTFLKNGNNPLNAFSPRFSVAYHLTPKFDLTGSIGTYYKIPTYTSLGYRNTAGDLVNQDMKYIRSTHYVLGTQFLPNKALRITVEGFFKQYANYPVSAATGVSLANQGSEFGSIGSEKVNSNGNGEAIGFEVFVQQKLIKNIFYVVSYTFVRSKFSGANGQLIPSSWDSRHLISATLGYKFKKGYEMGLKYRFAGGAPYTPYDLVVSQQNYLLTGTGSLNTNLLNTNRLQSFNQLDVRVDKKINFKRTALDLYIDIQNVLALQTQGVPQYTFKRNADNTDFETTDGNPIKPDGSNGVPVILDNFSKTVVPTIGLIFEF